MSVRPLLTTDFLTAVTGDHVSWFWLVKLELASGNLFLTSLNFDVEIDGETWIGSRGLGSIAPIEESSNGVNGANLVLAGVTQEHIAGMLTENVRGKKVTIKIAVLNTATEPPLLAIDPNVWQGLLDTQTFNEGQASVVVTAENRLIEWDKPRMLRFSNQDLKRTRPNDNFFKYADAMANKQIIVFSKAQVKATMRE